VYTAGKGVVDTILEHSLGDANPKAKGLLQVDENIHHQND